MPLPLAIHTGNLAIAPGFPVQVFQYRRVANRRGIAELSDLGDPYGISPDNPDPS